MPYESSPVVVMLAFSETVTVFPSSTSIRLVVLMPALVPVSKAIPRLTVSPPSIASGAIEPTAPLPIVPTPFVLPSLLVLLKTSAMTGVDKARQTKADLPSRKTLQCLGFVEAACDIVVPFMSVRKLKVNNLEFLYFDLI